MPGLFPLCFYLRALGSRKSGSVGHSAPSRQKDAPFVLCGVSVKGTAALQSQAFPALCSVATLQVCCAVGCPLLQREQIDFTSQLALCWWPRDQAKRIGARITEILSPACFQETINGLLAQSIWSGVRNFRPATDSKGIVCLPGRGPAYTIRQCSSKGHLLSFP